MTRGTLSRQLALRVAALVALVAIVLGLVSSLAVSRFMTSQLDNQLSTALATQGRPPGPADDSDVLCTASGSHNPGRRAFGLPPHSVVVTYLPATGTGCGQIVESGTSSSVSPTELSALVAAAPLNSIGNVSIAGLGNFRAKKSLTTVSYGGVSYQRYQVVALSTGAVDHVIRQMLALEGAVTLLALGGALVLSRAIVTRSLRPLNRLADAATTVSNLALDKGEVTLAVRVPASAADPHNEVGRVGAAFNHMLNNVEGALAARQYSETKVRQFVADASHELRNPLAAIRGYSELTRRHRDDLPPDTAFAMQRIEAESERMSRLVEDMLLLARLDNDPDLDLTEVDVVELVLNAASDAQVAGPDHTWRLQLPAEPVVASADAFRLHQVVVNLLANARKHTPPGTVVTTGVRAEDGCAVISVSDNGPGIDDSVRDTLFERFARADTARAHHPDGSTGLGLAIVSAVMDAHHGSAEVASRPGHTTFTLRLPLA